jgi:hypothetical protein
MTALSNRMQPWDAAVPSGAIERGPLRPWRAIWPGPPSNSCRTLEKALVASAQRPSGDPVACATCSTTKNWPRGVGVAGVPTTTRSCSTGLPFFISSTTRRARITTSRHGEDTRLTDVALIHPARPFGRPGSRTRSHRAPRPSRRSEITGNAVCWRVSGRTAEIVATSGLAVRGSRRAGVVSNRRAIVTAGSEALTRLASHAAVRRLRVAVATSSARRITRCIPRTSSRSRRAR